MTIHRLIATSHDARARHKAYSYPNPEGHEECRQTISLNRAVMKDDKIEHPLEQRKLLIQRCGIDVSDEFGRPALTHSELPRVGLFHLFSMGSSFEEA